MTNLTDAAAVIQQTREELARDNAKAEQERDKRDWETLRQLIERHGVCNVVGVMADLVTDMSDYDHDDYELASEVLAAAALGCDMPYGAVPQVSRRQRAIADFKDAAARVRA